MVVRYPPPRKRSRLARLALPAAALALAAVLAALFWPRPAEQQEPVAEPQPTSEPVSAAPQKPPQRQEPVFDFYDDLQREQVPVAQQNQTLKYWFQVGSFELLQDAQERRVHLLLLGLDAQLEQKTTASGQRYRVLVGPFSGRKNLAEARHLIEREGFALMLRKTPPADAPTP